MSGHILMFDGDMLGINPNMSRWEVWDILTKHGLYRPLVMCSCEVVIVINLKNYYLKDRAFGRCDFKQDPAPENPICGT